MTITHNGVRVFPQAGSVIFSAKPNALSPIKRVAILSCSWRVYRSRWCSGGANLPCCKERDNVQACPGIPQPESAVGNCWYVSAITAALGVRNRKGEERHEP